MNQIHKLFCHCGTYYPWNGEFTCEHVSPEALFVSTICDGDSYSVTVPIRECQHVQRIFYSDFSIHVECSEGCDSSFMLFFDPKSKTWVLPHECKKSAPDWDIQLETDRDDIYLLIQYEGSVVDVCKRYMGEKEPNLDYDVEDDMRFLADELRLITHASLKNGVLTFYQVDMVDFYRDENYSRKATTETHVIADWLGTPPNNSQS